MEYFDYLDECFEEMDYHGLFVNAKFLKIGNPSANKRTRGAPQFYGSFKKVSHENYQLLKSSSPLSDIAKGINQRINLIDGKIFTHLFLEGTSEEFTGNSLCYSDTLCSR